MPDIFTEQNLRNAFNARFTSTQIVNINKMYNHLKNNLHWPDRNIAAVMGNIMLESAFNYGQVSSAGATGAFLFLGDVRKDYNKWRLYNGYRDGGLSQASYLDYVIQNNIDKRMDSVLNARDLLKNENHADSINANKILVWAEPAIKNGTFYPMSDLNKAWNDNNMSLDDFTVLFSHTIERAGSDEKNNEQRKKYAKVFYKMIPKTKRVGGIINYLDYSK